MGEHMVEGFLGEFGTAIHTRQCSDRFTSHVAVATLRREGGNHDESVHDNTRHGL